MFLNGTFSGLPFRMLELFLAKNQVEVNPSDGFDCTALDNLSQGPNEYWDWRIHGFYLVYLLLKLALTLPVITATMERVFSGTKIIKNRLRNRMEDEWMNDCLLANIKKDIFNSIDDETIMQRFQNM